MAAQRVEPELVGVLGVAHRDVAGRPEAVALASEDAEGGRHFLKHPLALISYILELGNCVELVHVFGVVSVDVDARAQRGRLRSQRNGLRAGRFSLSSHCQKI